MPFINTTTNKKVTKEQEALLVTKLGKAIEVIPGKTEEYLMLNLADEQRMAFRGKSDGEYAMVEVAIFGSSSPKALADFTREVTKVISDVLRIPADDIYVNYTAHDTWGSGGVNF